MEIEITRFIFAMMCGYFLTVSGSLSQLVCQNTMASPSTLGMDGFAVLFVIVSQFFYLTGELSLLYSHLAFLFFTLFLVLIVLTQFRNKGKVIRQIWQEIGMDKVILFGLAFNLMVGAIFSIIQFLFMALNFEFPSGLWFGSLKQYELSYLPVFIFVFILCKLFILGIISKLEILNLGSSFAASLGVDVKKIQKSTLILALLLTGIVISYFGVFSFLGLIFPHILRSFKWFKISMKRELVVGPYLTGLFFGIVDQLCYQFDIYGAELPVGMVSSVIGAIFLIFLVLKSKISQV